MRSFLIVSLLSAFLAFVLAQDEIPFKTKIFQDYGWQPRYQHPSDQSDCESWHRILNSQVDSYRREPEVTRPPYRIISKDRFFPRLILRTIDHRRPPPEDNDYW
ncbi:choline/ethanolamine kinase [Sarcoptes scabiei]|uniref:Uncharacterized protein n=1 Tax=Sarcoptes scabiei TaxID=52283 RepID=A0A131ZYE7_SARSC|nr:hypothetical protein QR98_0017560 [Sarcoptes scabiei]UXI20524.1 choline/ethanolamine kinase [Sarcoptes scabiei]